MEKEGAAAASAAIARENHTAPAPSSSSAPPPPRWKKDWTPEEQKAARAFLWVGFQDTFAYMGMTEDDVVEEYRRAGRLHTYDPDVEVEKRYVRVAKKAPPPDGFDPRLEEFMKLIDDED